MEKNSFVCVQSHSYSCYAWNNYIQMRMHSCVNKIIKIMSKNMWTIIISSVIANKSTISNYPFNRWHAKRNPFSTDELSNEWIDSSVLNHAHPDQCFCLLIYTRLDNWRKKEKSTTENPSNNVHKTSLKTSLFEWILL